MKPKSSFQLSKRLLAFLLTLVLALTPMVSQSVYADESQESVQTEAVSDTETKESSAETEESSAVSESISEEDQTKEASEVSEEKEETKEASEETKETSKEAEQSEENEDIALQASTDAEVYGSVSDYTAAWKDSNFKAGTYTVTANLSMPGQYNPVLTGVTVYANNPNNPFGPVTDAKDPAENVENSAPTTPLKNNATLTVAEDGTLTLSLPIKNPVFTTQKIGTASNLAFTADKLAGPYTYGSYSIESRIYKLTATLGKVDLSDANVATYTFKGSELYALPINTWLKPEGDIALQLDVDLSSVTKTLVPEISECTYTGEEQTAIAESDLYTVTAGDAKATDAGEYSATLTLTDAAKEAGYAWKDSDTDNLEVTWSIAKAALTASYVSENVKADGTPELKVEVTGFVNDETAETAADYKAPTVTAPKKFELGQTYDLTPAGGEAKNYSFTYEAGKLTVSEEEKTLAAGTYKITANLTVKGENNVVLPGVQIYPGTNNFPPVVGDENDAILVVKENGDKYITLDFSPNGSEWDAAEVFTIQSIADGTNIHVTDITRGAGIGATEYNQYTDRIIKVTFKVDDCSSEYALGACSQWPTLLMMETNMPMHLLVDWDSVTPTYVEPEDGSSSWSKTYTDDAAGVSVTISTTEKSVGEKLEEAVFDVKKMAEGTELSEIQTTLEPLYEGDFSVNVYDIALEDPEGKEISLSGNTKADVTFTTSAEKVDSYRVNGTEPEEMELQKASSDGAVSYTVMEKLGRFAIVDSSNAYRWYSREFTDDETGVNVSLSVTNKENADIGTSIKQINYSTKAGTNENGDKIYSFGFGSVIEDLFGATPQEVWYKNQTKVTLSLPADENTKFYVVTEYKGMSQIGEELDAEIKDGRATINILPIDYEADGQNLLNSLYYYTKDEANYEHKYIIATTGELKYASAPMINSNNDARYLGVNQKGYIDGSNYEVVSGTAEALEAGSYTLVVKPKEGYTWIDGTTDEKTLNWKISKAILTVTAEKDAYITEPGVVPDVKLTVTGFVNGETAETAEAYVAPDVHGEYESYNKAYLSDYGDCVHPLLGASAKNYQFTTKSFTIYVPLTDYSKELKSLERTYTGSTQAIGVNVNQVYSFNEKDENADRLGKDVGTYSVKVTLNDDYLKIGGTWPDGTTEPKIFTWKINPAELTATYAGENIDTDGTPELKVDVTGFKRNETAATAADYVAPTLTAPESLEGGQTYTLTPEGGSAKNYTFTYVAGELKVTGNAVAPTVKSEEVVYNGESQSGISGGSHYTVVSGDANATDAGSYSVTVKPEDGYVWEDGSSDEVTLNWEIKAAELTATYAGETIDADGTPSLKVDVTGFVNGESAASAADYVTPTVSAPKTIEAGKTYELTPEGGSAKNYTFNYEAGKLVVNEKEEPVDPDEPTDTDELAPGTYQITANVYLPGELNTQLQGVTAYMTNPDNPVGIGGHTGIPNTPVSNNAKLVVGEDGSRTIVVDLVNPVFTLQKISSGDNVEVLAAERDSETYSGNTGVSRNGRITTLYLKLKDNSGTYQFSDCTEFPTLLEADWNVPLRMSVDFASAKKTSDSTEVTLPETKEDTTHTETPAPTQTPTNSTNNGNGGSNTVGTDTNKTENTVTKLKPGTYTVTANIWFNKADTGLPMNPHITSSVFPPKDPVANNATLTVDANNHAYVTVPITIQSKVMTVRSISGLNITDMTKNSDGAITSITIDLGVLEDPDAVITQSCNVDIWMGDLAMSISGFSKEHSWPATFQLNLTGVATESGVASADGVKGSGSLTKNGVASGDSTPIALYVSLLGVSVLVMTIAVRKKSKKR